MATIQQLEDGLRKAHAQGNADHARRFAEEIRRVRSAQPDFSGVTGGASSPAPASAPAQGAAPSGERRGLGLGARSVVQGVGSLIGAAGGDAFNAYVAVPLERAITGRDVQPESYRDAAGRLADTMGLPKPQDSRERVLGDVGEALTGTGLTMGAGGALNALRALGQGGGGAVAQPASRIGQLLTAQPGLQAVSTATGAGASSVSRESGGSQGQQLAAGLVGGLAPGAAGFTAATATRGLVRGRSGADMQRTIDDFNALGATPTVGQASQNRIIQGGENLLGGAPTSAGVVNRFAERQAEDIGSGLQRLANNTSRNASAERAGRAIERGIHGPDGFTAQYKQTQQQMFDRLDEFIPAGHRISVSNTTEALGRLNAPIPGAPNVSRLFQNGRIAGIEGALQRDLATPTDAQRALDEALTKIDGLYASRDSAVQDMGRFQAFANDQANRTNRFYPVEGQPRFPGRYSEFPARAAEGTAAAADAQAVAAGRVSQAQQLESALSDLQAAAAATNGRLPYEAIKKLRTLVGQEIDNAGLMSDFPRDKWKALYGALSDDLRGAALEAGPAASQAFNRANNYTRAGMGRVESIQRVVDKNGGPEAIYNAAMQGTRDGGTTLRAVMQSLPPDGQRAVTAAVMRRMGMATPGAQDAAGDVFSANTFLTNWNRVSPEAKRALFDRHGPQFSRDMDRVARVAANIKDGSRVLANPSGTANRAAAMTYGASLVASMFDPSMVTTGGLLMSGAGANYLARKMTDPEVVRWLANATALPVGSAVAQNAALRQIGERKGDEEIVALADELDRQKAQNDGAQAADDRQ